MTEVLEQGQGRVDHAGAGPIDTPGRLGDRADQIVAMPGLLGDQRQQHEAQVAATEIPASTTAMSTAVAAASTASTTTTVPLALRTTTTAMAEEAMTAAVAVTRGSRVMQPGTLRGHFVAKPTGPPLSAAAPARPAFRSKNLVVPF